ncbi:MAG: hypothetical protein ACK4NC_04835 [Candidatus Gracilibacteria bacterium]
MEFLQNLLNGNEGVIAFCGIIITLLAGAGVVWYLKNKQTIKSGKKSINQQTNVGNNINSGNIK